MFSRIALMTLLALAWLFAASCSGAESTSCQTDDDCFAGESCHDGTCSSAPGNGNDGTSSSSNNGEQNNHSSTDNSNENNGSNTANNSNQSNQNQSVPAPKCTLPEEENVGECESGHDELEDNGVMNLFPDGIEAGGCAIFGDHDSFIDLEETTWTIEACPGANHRIQFPLDDCRNQKYTAYLSIEPVDTGCALDEYAEMYFSPDPEDGVSASCEERQRTYSCFDEKAHEEGGGFDWTIYTNEDSTTSAHPWYIEIELDFDWDVRPNFEYQVTAHVPPLEE